MFLLFAKLRYTSSNMAIRHANAHYKAMPEARPTCDTPLRRWLEKEGLSAEQFAKHVGASFALVSRWADGRSIPHLVHAARVEMLTGGEVPAAAWLATEIGKSLLQGTKKYLTPGQRKWRRNRALAEKRRAKREEYAWERLKARRAAENGAP